jgi:TRAP transporter TAXI family solute receptor
VTTRASLFRRVPRWAVAAVCGLALLLASAQLYVSSRAAAERPTGLLRITSGATKGVYNSFAVELAGHLRARDSKLRVSVESSTGSVENLNRIAGGEADCGLSAGDAAALAIAGTAPFERPLPIQAVARVYDDYVHLVVRAGSNIRSVSDLTGQTVSLGSPGSGVQLISARVLQAVGISKASLHPVSLGINESIDALRAAKIDAFFWSGGLPTNGVAELARTSPVRLVPLGDVATALGSNYNAVYRTAAIPASTYGLSAPLETVAVPNFIVCNSSVPNDVVTYLAKTLFTAQSAIAAVVPPVNVMDLRTAIATDPVPLHPGALRWYRQTKN